MILKKDCGYFSGDKPCTYHKENGIKCDDCGYYNPINFKILIVKLDAVGDVLRTTSILPAVKKKYPGSHITWCTKKNSKDLFVNNPFVDELIFVEEDAYFRLSVEEYDLVANLDTSKFSASIASFAKGKIKSGFVLSTKGYVEPVSSAANEWLEMSAFDDVKKANKKSYQEIIYSILALESEIYKPVINIPESIKNKIKSLAKDWQLSAAKTIGLNIGVGSKWPSKSWPINKWEQLIEILKKKNLNLLLLGGPEEKAMIAGISKRYDYVVNTGTDNPLMEFSAIIDLCDVLITADSLALHIGTALNKPIIALFGPTSSNEIFLYGRGEKIISSKECKCYYNRSCSEKVSCMDGISPQAVADSINVFTM